MEISKTEEKLRELQGLLSQMGRAVVAFSGGVTVGERSLEVNEECSRSFVFSQEISYRYQHKPLVHDFSRE